MTDHKYTDEEVIKALHICENYAGCCSEYCPMIKDNDCRQHLMGQTKDLIHRQRAEIDDLTRDTIPKLKNGLERANKYGVELKKSLANVRAEAIKEFAERLKLYGRKNLTDSESMLFGIIITNVMNELTEGKPCTDSDDCSTCENCYRDGGYNECATDGVK